MATIGDLVVRLRSSNDGFAKNMLDATRSARQLDYDVQKLRRSQLQSEDSANRLGRALADPAARAAEWARVQAKSNLEVQQSIQVNDRLSASLANRAVQANEVALAELNLDRQLLEARQQTQLMASVQQNAGMQAKQLALDEMTLAQSLRDAQAATARQSAELSNATIQNAQLGLEIERSNQAVIGSRQSNEMLSQSLSNRTLQSNQLLLAEQDLDRQLLESQQQTQLMASTQQNAAMRAKMFGLEELKVSQALATARSETQMLGLVTGSSSVQNDRLALSVERSTQALIRERAELALLKRELADTTLQTNQLELSQIRLEKESLQVGQAMRSTGVSTGKTQLAISQLIFAVDDASTVYGTSGLSGAVRAAGNNLTMFASLLGGPVALGFAVAVSAATQLYLTFNKNTEATVKAKSAEEEYQETLRKRNEVFGALMRIHQESQQMSSVADLDSRVQQKRNDQSIDIELENRSRAEYDQRQAEIDTLTREYERRLIGQNADGSKTEGMGGFIGFLRDQRIGRELGQKLQELQKLQAVTSADMEKHLAERTQKEQEINALLDEREGIRKREIEEQNKNRIQEMRGQINQQTGQNRPDAGLNATLSQLYQRRDLISEAGGGEYHALMASANQSALEQLQKQSLEVLQSLETEPQSRRRQAVEEHERREQQIRLYAPETEQAGLIQRSLQMSLAAFKTDSKVGGPSGLEANSKEALERIRQRQLEAGKPKETQEGLMKQFLEEQKRIKENAAKQTGYLEKIYLAQPTEGAFDS